MNFCCQSCNRICDWHTRLPVVLDGRIYEYKTVANRYCNAEECRKREAEVRGVSR